MKEKLKKAMTKEEKAHKAEGRMMKAAAKLHKAEGRSMKAEDKAMKRGCR